MYLVARIVVLGVILGCWTASLFAQWPSVVTKVPRTASGAPNLNARAPRLADGKTPDFSGVWESERQACNESKEPLGCIDAQGGVPQAFINIAGGNTEKLPMQAWAEALVKERKANAGKDDPIARCLPVAPLRGWADFPLQKIIQTPDSMTILGEYMLQFRQIFFDGRRLPTNPEPTFKGYSAARWEGDTLVVDTIGLKDDGWLDSWGHPLTDRAHAVERIRRVNYGTLEVRITVDDPKAYTKPWSVTRKLLLVPNTELLEYVCNENEKSLQHMVGADVN